MKLYGNLGSGNCLKVKWVCDLLGVSYAWEEIDVVKGESRTPEFLALNPMGQVPFVVFDDGSSLAQSNGIITYLAEGTRLLPADPFAHAKINELMFWEQYSHEPYIAVCRYHMEFLGRGEAEREPWRVERGEQALDLMEQLISGRDWFVGESFTIADIALVAYTRVAHEGGFDLTSRPQLRAWVSRCESELGLAD